MVRHKDSVRDDIKEKGLSGEEMYDRATYHHMLTLHKSRTKMKWKKKTSLKYPLEGGTDLSLNSMRSGEPISSLYRFARVVRNSVLKTDSRRLAYSFVMYTTNKSSCFLL